MENKIETIQKVGRKMRPTNVQYKVIMRENVNGRVEVDRVYMGRSMGENRVAWKPVDKRKFTSNVLNTVESFVAR
jgi:hypothetical protein|tara:strand:+ start:571 stop:795 length:225 start_codon:yes stop_codon:yes gene_type:complete